MLPWLLQRHKLFCAFCGGPLCLQCSRLDAWASHLLVGLDLAQGRQEAARATFQKMTDSSLVPPPAASHALDAQHQVRGLLQRTDRLSELLACPAPQEPGGRASSSAALLASCGLAPAAGVVGLGAAPDAGDGEGSAPPAPSLSAQLARLDARLQRILAARPDLALLVKGKLLI